MQNRCATSNCDEKWNSSCCRNYIFADASFDLKLGSSTAERMHKNPRNKKGDRNTNVIINDFFDGVSRFCAREIIAFAIYSHFRRILLVFFFGPVLFKDDLLEQHRRFVYAFTQPRDVFHKRFPDAGTCSLFACTTSRDIARIAIGIQSLFDRDF